MTRPKYHIEEMEEDDIQEQIKCIKHFEISSGRKLLKIGEGMNCYEPVD